MEEVKYNKQKYYLKKEFNDYSLICNEDGTGIFKVDNKKVKKVKK